ncbi:MAG: CsbD family protein [Planctomycetes bacterium]|nr:CsbD family protein [Planctomycetota bacterium]
MNWSTVQGNWNEAKGKVKTKWGRLTDDDLMQVSGNQDRLVGMIQQKYGIGREKAEEQLNEFLTASDGGMIAKAKEGVQDVVEKGKEVVQKGREYVEQGVEKAKEGVHDVVEKGKEYAEKGKEYVQNTSMSQMATDIKDLIGRNPVQSAIIGIGLGFLIGKMLTSSNRS